MLWYFVDFKRVGPKSGPPLVEKVLSIFQSRDRTAFIALVGHADIKRYILATQNMKVGDLIRTSGEIPRVPVKAFEGSNLIFFKYAKIYFLLKIGFMKNSRLKIKNF